MPEQVNNRKWTDNKTVVWGLLSAIGTLLVIGLTFGMTFASMLYGNVTARIDKNETDIDNVEKFVVEQKVQNAEQKAQNKSILDKLDQISEKIDNGN